MADTRNVHLTQGWTDRSNELFAVFAAKLMLPKGTLPPRREHAVSPPTRSPCHSSTSLPHIISPYLTRHQTNCQDARCAETEEDRNCRQSFRRYVNSSLHLPALDSIPLLCSLYSASFVALALALALALPLIWETEWW